MRPTVNFISGALLLLGRTWEDSRWLSLAFHGRDDSWCTPVFGHLQVHLAFHGRWWPLSQVSPNPLVTIHKYPGADHAFACHGGKTYSKPEADRALALTLEFFNKHLG